MRKLLSGGDTALPKGFYDRQNNYLDPHVAGRFEFWGPLDMQVELKAGDEVRFKTKGDSIFLDTVAKHGNGLEVNRVVNYHGGGEETLGHWGGKIAAAKQNVPDTPLQQDQVEGV